MAYEPSRPAVRRSREDRVFAGVCGGLGAALGLDATAVRIGWVLLTLLGGSGLALYLVAWWVIPDAEGNRSNLPLALMLLVFAVPFTCFVCGVLISALSQSS